MKVIGINGFKRSGKGETGNAIQEALAQHPHYQETALLGFADKLKILGARTLGFVDLDDQACIALMDECKETWEFAITRYGVMEPDPAWLLTRPTPAGGWSTKEPVTTITGRQYLQHLGTEARKVFGVDFWVDQVLPRVSDAGHVPLGFSVQDYLDVALQARYPKMSTVAFTDLRFENEAQRIRDLGGEVWEVIRPGTASDGHDSEQVLPRELISRQIDNSGDLMALRYEVEKALEL